MFLSYKYTTNFNFEEGKYHYQFRIIDTGFETNVEIELPARSPAANVARSLGLRYWATAIAVIKTYENGNLSLNFFRYIQYVEKVLSWKIADQLVWYEKYIKMADQLAWYEKYITKYQEIKLDLLKYINLI